MSKLSLASIFFLLLLGCEKAPDQQRINEQISKAANKVEDPTIESQPQKLLPASAFMSAEWLDLIPEDDLEVLLNPPAYLDEIPENSAEDQLDNTGNNNVINAKPTRAEGDAEAERYQQALASTRVISAVNNVPIRIPAFIVPLEFDDEQRVTQFFMVPFFGACIHLPPPLPNQTIFVNYPQGFKLDDLTEAYWVSGIIKTSKVENDLATAAYTMEVHHLELYTEE